MVAFGFGPPRSKRLRHDARPGLELAIQLRQQLHVDRRQQVHRHDRRLADVGVEHVLLNEPHPIADRLGLRLSPAPPSPAPD
jgi:hypothetical protein